MWVMKVRKFAVGLEPSRTQPQCRTAELEVEREKKGKRRGDWVGR